MSSIKLLAVTLFATAVIGAPAIARETHTRSHRVVVDTAAAPAPLYIDGRLCIPAPRVGAFATAPWGNNDIPCEPSYGYGYGGNYGY
jgi:hypothetical protein